MRRVSVQTARKERTDKKRQVAPTISGELKREIERLAYILDRPVKDVGVCLCREGLSERDVVNVLASYFQRGSLRFGSTVYRGNFENPKLGDMTLGHRTERVSLRFERADYEDMRLLADLLDATVARAVGFLLGVSLAHKDVIDRMLARYGHRHTLTDDMAAEIKRLDRYVRRASYK